jgi:hypothetical protein
MLIRFLKLFGTVSGIWLIVVGINRMSFSTITVPGSGRVSPTVDSEVRIAGAMFIGLGVAYLWTFWRPRIPVPALRLLALTMALIGVARLNSMAEVGLPDPLLRVATAVEFTVAGLTYWYSTLRVYPNHPDDADEPDDHRP